MSKWIYKGRHQPDSILSISNTISNIIFFSPQHQAQFLSCPLPVRHFLKNSRYHSTHHPNPTHFNFKMRFFTAATFVLAAAAAPVDRSETSASGQIEKRLDPITISIITGVTSYDCFYLKSGGEFKGNGDGGFINIAADTNNGACGFLASNLLMTCQ
ncbi:hypothetical protein LA080_012932 [Diaporthe eres]|nr:hypothetical protein LA080_012932 [Diaporthe eres]